MTLDNDYLVLNGLIFSLENDHVNWREVKSGEWPVILKENWLIAKNQDETLHLLADKSDTLMVAGGKIGHQLHPIATTNFNRDPTKRNPIKWANACFLDKNSILVSEWNQVHLFYVDQLELNSRQLTINNNNEIPIIHGENNLFIQSNGNRIEIFDRRDRKKQNTLEQVTKFITGCSRAPLSVRIQYLNSDQSESSI